MAVIEGEILSLANDGPTEEELDKAKKYLIGSYALRFDTSTKIANQLLHLQTDGFGVEYLDERNKLIAAVTMQDAKRADQAPFRRRQTARHRRRAAGGDVKEASKRSARTTAFLRLQEKLPHRLAALHKIHCLRHCGSSMTVLNGS